MPRSIRAAGLVAAATVLFVQGAAASPSTPPGDKVPSGGTVRLELIAEGFTSPLTLVEPSDGSGRLFIVDQIGVIRVLLPDGTLLADPFLDLTDQIVELMPEFDERGLLGLAFHPSYSSNGRLFVYYIAPLRPGGPEGYDSTATLSEFLVSADDPNRADPDSERVLLQIDKPQFNHDGGMLAFGPDDGFLYLAIGDGGGANDVELGHVEDWYEANAGGNGQDVAQNLLGNILRIDVDSGDPYAVPPDNPFVGEAGLDEIWAYGLRNPYQFAFDPGGDHRLFTGDAGQDLWEEVDIIVRGGNYGWNVKEGTHCFDAENPDEPPAQCPDVVLSGSQEGDPLIDPIIEYPNAHNPIGGLGHVVVGGRVYRGDELPQLAGRYVFGDWSREEEEPDGSIFVAKEQKKGLWNIQELLLKGMPGKRLGHFLLGFGQDLSGEVYILGTLNVGPTGATGKVFKIVSPGG